MEGLIYDKDIDELLEKKIGLYTIETGIRKDNPSGEIDVFFMREEASDALSEKYEYYNRCEFVLMNKISAAFTDFFHDLKDMEGGK